MANIVVKGVFLEQLQRKGVNLTTQRLAVVKEIAKFRGHFEIEQLLKLLQAKELGISRATVYRTLEILQDHSLVKKLDLGLQGRVYEAVTPGEHHDHLICTECKQVIDFDSAELEKLQQSICDKFKFFQVSHTHSVFGFCQQCQIVASDNTNFSRQRNARQRN